MSYFFENCKGLRKTHEMSVANLRVEKPNIHAVIPQVPLNACIEPYKLYLVKRDVGLGAPGGKLEML
ncbi:hypothetical protein [Pseudobutyrivibrio sp.]|jgi:hypothetical protein|uniref:hypothetical protein n=1 Tax=Pseudobutyrivibrio sp. TaxID=2014367 RepID=UPI0025F6DC5C|nr:hypothetical protein [Pseudobutyrivibrio sp.]